MIVEDDPVERLKTSDGGHVDDQSPGKPLDGAP